MIKLQPKRIWRRTGEYTQLGEAICENIETGERAAEKDNKYLVKIQGSKNRSTSRIKKAREVKHGE